MFLRVSSLHFGIVIDLNVIIISYEIVILRKSHGEIIRVCMGIFQTALRNVNTIKFSIKIPHLNNTVHRFLC